MTRSPSSLSLSSSSSECCVYHHTHTRHPHFAYMITITDEGKAAGCNSDATHLGISRDPRKRLVEQNRKSKLRRNGSRVTGTGAPYWQLEMIIGPFSKGAKHFVKKWKKKRRTSQRRINYGIEMAQSSYYHKQGVIVIFNRTYALPAPQSQAPAPPAP